MIFGRYTFILKLKDDAILPFYKGSTFRGVLGHALKKTVCALKHQTCATCILRKNCTYALVFETAHAVEMPDLSRISSPPHPMVLEPPLTQRTMFNKGEFLEYSLLLFGQLNQNLPHFIYAFDQMGQMGIGKKINGKRSRFVLETVKQSDSVLFSEGDESINLPEKLETINLAISAPRNRKKMLIKMITPLRILSTHNGNPALEFQILVKSMIRRTTALLNSYGKGEPDLDYSGLVKKAGDIKITENKLTWFDWQRYSAKQDKKMFMGGLTGEIEYRGDLALFMPLIEASEKVHIGKNTSFGLGKIATKNVDNKKGEINGISC